MGLRRLLLPSLAVVGLAGLVSARGWAIADFSAGSYGFLGFAHDLALAGGIVAGAIATLAGLRRLSARLVPERRRGWRLALTVIRLAAVATLFGPLAATAFQLHPPRIAARGTPTQLGLDFESVALRTEDGLELAGWLIPPPDDFAPMALLAHGIGGNRGTLLGPAALLHELGFGVLLFDFRGHGDSEGWTVTLGLREALDVKAGRDWVAARHPGRPVVALGFSMGAASVLQAACRSTEFDATILDSSFARLEAVGESRYASLGKVRAVVWRLMAFWARAFTGLDFEARQPVDCVARAAERPLLLIHGQEDSFIRASHALELAGRAPSAELWLVENAGHLGAFAAPGYRERLTGFLSRHEISPRGTAPGSASLR